MNEKQILEYCIRNKVSVEQYFIIYLTRRRAEGWRQEYLNYTSVFPWSEDDIFDLHKKKIISFPPGPVPKSGDVSMEGFILAEDLDESEGALQSTEMGEELYTNYPATFSLSGGGMFIARTGMNKQKLISSYLDKIGRDPERHQFVMQQLERYIKLVTNSKINGHKLSDWVENEMWDTIAQIPVDLTSAFKQDI